MPMIEALMIAVSGFLVVFIMLVILWGIIGVISRVVTAVEKKTQPVKMPEFAQPQTEPVIMEEPKKPHEIYGGEIALYDVDEKTAACIMAIVSDSSGIPLDHLIFKSIKALD